MKILYQHRTQADGAEGIHIAEMVEAFEAMGHTVVMQALAKAPKRGEGQTSTLGRIKGWLPRPLLEIATLAFNLVEYIGFRRVLRRERPDIVYKRHAIYDIGICLAARHAGVPLVLEVNCPYSSPGCQRFEPNSFPALVQLCERTAVNLATLAFTVSTPMKQLLLDAGADGNHIIVVPNGANPARFTAVASESARVRATLGLGSTVVVGWAGILREWHRLELVFAALERVPSLTLLVIGDGPDRPRLEALVEQHNLTGRVFFTGRVPHDEMAGYVGASDITVVSDDRTGFASPMKLLEYMAMGRAVAAPRLRNIEDIVDDGRDGLLFTPRDPESLATALRRLVEDPALREQLGREARLKIEQTRNWRSIAEVILRALGERIHTSSAPMRRLAVLLAQSADASRGRS
jgi:glycosyltransferase involved in cell wall biosynthesis